MQAPNNIFISYRRDEAAGFARAVHEQLVARFPSHQVFMDVDNIEPGLPFDEAIQRAISECAVLLVLIGRRWLEPTANGQSRLFEPADFVRREIAAALSGDTRVIPVLLDGAAMPSEAQLPELLQPLARRNAIELANSRFSADIDRLASVVGRALGDDPKSVHARRWPLAILISGPIVLVAGAVAWWISPFDKPAASLRPTQDRWRFCSKCSTLFFNGYANKGVCPGGASHTAEGYNFVLPHDSPTLAQEQGDWRFCHKCVAMFFDGASSKGICSAGGQHSAAGHNFRLAHDAQGAGQRAWRYCKQCAVMFFDGYATKGRCAAGSEHTAAGFEFVLPFT